MKPSQRRATLLACAFVAVAALGQIAAGADASSAADVLQAHGLEHAGSAWCLPAEVELRQRVSSLDKLQQRLIAAQQAVDQLIAQNELLKRQMLQFEQLEKQSRAQAAGFPPNTPQRAQLDAQAKESVAAAAQRRRQYVRPPQLGLSPPLRPALADLIVVRTELMVRLLPMRATLDRLGERYDALRRDNGVMAALASVGPEESLGRLKNLRDNWRIVDKLQSMVFNDSLPVAREGSFYCITAIANERQPLTFSYFANKDQQMLIPQNLAEAAGIVIDAHTPKSKVLVARGRTTMAWRVKLPQLRFGRHVLHGVDAFVLPPEAADIGARIGSQSFAGYRVQLDAERLTLTVSGGK